MTPTEFIRKWKPVALTERAAARGREAFASISAVDGIVLDEEAKEAFADFDRRKLTPEERRWEIVARFKRKGG
jgi:hypothetical protein